MLTDVIIVIVLICTAGAAYQQAWGTQNQIRKLREEQRKRDQL